jgi:hypothetical protein
VIALTATGAWAQIATTGQLSGVVEDQEGTPLPGVTVKATSPALQGERATVTGRDGKFDLRGLPTGLYNVRFRMEGFQLLSLENLRIKLGQIVPIKAILQEGEMRETVTVTASFPLIAPKTADTSMNLAGEKLDSIPTAARTFTDLTKFVPSITSTEFNSTDPTSSAAPAPSIRGEGQYGDNYLVDGLSVRDPSVKTSGTPLNFDAIEEVQIITDGFSPEFGQSLGGSVNVITKSGSNNFGGEVAYIYRDEGTTADFDNTLLATPDEYEREDPYVNVGGPILKDKLWYFGSYNRSDDLDGYAAAELSGYGTLPPGVEETETDLYFGKLTYAINAQHNIAGSYTMRDQETTGFDAAIATPEARRGQEVDDERTRLNYQAIFSANTLLEIKYGNVNREIQTVPLGSLDPAQYEITTYGLLTNNAWRASSDERDRDDYAAIFTQFWNPGGRAGSHEFKVGVDYRELNQDSGDWFSGLAEDIFVTGLNPDGDDFGLADTFENGMKYQFSSVGGLIIPTNATNYRSSGILNNENEEFGGFMQDRWETGNWNFLIGFRVDKQEGFNDIGDTYFEYDLADAFAPRASITWDASGDGRNIVKMGYGRFYDASSLRLGEFANSRESFSFRAYSWVGGVDEDYSTHVGDGSVYDIWEVSNWAFDHEQSADSNPLDYGGLEEPAHLDRFLLEYDRQIGNDYVVKGRYVDGETRGLIEDIHFFYNDWQVVNTDLKRRDYTAFELEFNGNPTPNISFNTAYVRSQAKGTNPGQFELSGFLGDSGSGNNIGVFLDRPPSNPEGWCELYAPDCIPGFWDPTDPHRDYNDDDVLDEFDRDMFIQYIYGGLGAVDGNDGWYGNLPYSLDDVVKMGGRFVIPKWQDTYINAFFQWASGYNNDRNGFQPAYGDYFTFSQGGGDFVYTDLDPGNGVDDCAPGGDFALCETLQVTHPVQGQNFDEEGGVTRGSIEGPSFWTLDLSVGKVWNFGKSYSVELRGEIFNVFNNQEILAPQDRATEDFGVALTRQFPRSARIFARFGF